MAHAPKRALQTPQREWMSNELKAQVEQTIGQLKTSRYNDWFDFKEMRDEWHRYQNGNQDS